MLGVRPQSLSELLSKLESSDLVTRRRDDTDRRTFVVELTEEGRKAAEEVSNHQDDDLFAVLSDEEQEQFTTLLDRVIESAEEKFPEIRERRIAMEERAARSRRLLHRPRLLKQVPKKLTDFFDENLLNILILSDSLSIT